MGTEGRGLTASEIRDGTAERLLDEEPDSDIEIELEVEPELAAELERAVEPDVDAAVGPDVAVEPVLREGNTEPFREEEGDSGDEVEASASDFEDDDDTLYQTAVEQRVVEDDIPDEDPTVTVDETETFDLLDDVAPSAPEKDRWNSLDAMDEKPRRPVFSNEPDTESEGGDTDQHPMVDVSHRAPAHVTRGPRSRGVVDLATGETPIFKRRSGRASPTLSPELETEFDEPGSNEEAAPAKARTPIPVAEPAPPPATSKPKAPATGATAQPEPHATEEAPEPGTAGVYWRAALVFAASFTLTCGTVLGGYFTLTNGNGRPAGPEPTFIPVAVAPPPAPVPPVAEPEPEPEPVVADAEPELEDEPEAEVAVAPPVRPPLRPIRRPPPAPEPEPEVVEPEPEPEVVVVVREPDPEPEVVVPEPEPEPPPPPPQAPAAVRAMTGAYVGKAAGKPVYLKLDFKADGDLRGSVRRDTGDGEVSVDARGEWTQGDGKVTIVLTERGTPEPAMYFGFVSGSLAEGRVSIAGKSKGKFEASR